jgi:hypothetical protein
MTRAELLTEKLLAEARGQLEITGSIKPLIVLLYPDGRKERAAFEVPHAMNSPGARERFYDSVRCYVQASQPQAVILLDGTCTGERTEKGQRIFEDNPAAFLREQERGLGHLVRLGLMARRESLAVNVQTADSVRIVTQFYERFTRRVVFTERQEMDVPQADFKGWHKMFGDSMAGKNSMTTTCGFSTTPVSAPASRAPARSVPPAALSSATLRSNQA